MSARVEAQPKELKSEEVMVAVFDESSGEGLMASAQWLAQEMVETMELSTEDCLEMQKARDKANLWVESLGQ